ncbi:MAG TPA: M20 family metallopeptidase [Terriglobia bacterium]|nr:M20 family metallopeptidase [Terriglobia bacterium]
MQMKDLVNALRLDLPRALKLLEVMVNMDSPSDDKTLVDGLVHFLGSHFQSIGGAVEYVPSDRFGNHLIARFNGPPAETRVLILGHTDTVFPAGEAEKRPFRIENGRAMGPGVFDMKAGILLAWSALKALQPLPRPVTVFLSSDEEAGSSSSRELIEREAGASGTVLVLEPSLPGGALKTARKGVGRFTVMATGRAAHAGIDPSRGINAIQEIAHQILQLQRLTDPLRGTTMTVGLVRGGSRVNVVPAEAVIEIDVRASSNEEAARITEAIRALRPHLEGAALHIRGGFNRPPMERTTETGRLFEIARIVAQELGFELQEGATGGGSDGNFTSAIGVPTLDGLGPIGDGAHALEEYVEIDSLPERAALIAGLISRV